MSAARVSRLGQAYLLGVPAVGLCILGWALRDLIIHPPRPVWIALPALAALTGSFTFRIPGSVVRLTVAEPIIFTATLLYGPAAGTVSAAIDAIAMSLRMGRHLRTAHRLAFNVALLSISIWPASLAFFALTGISPRQPSYRSLAQFIGPLYVFSAGVFFSNSVLLALALSIERGTSAFTIWRKQFSWVSTSYFASASIAALLVVYGPTIDAALIAVLAPLLLVSYLVFKTTVGRLDDANRHLAEVNSLYLSTIETLAMAIDAKDQVTHGHIRRVQKFAVGLARRLGVDDDRQLRAIEAAALLHDMGKLAIPEFILNKPGRLTPGEFDVMKTHAALGADILSAISFPYPVVPIVRHHHENWDGSGYPDGIRGVQIPVGARILSVVDCYDALTSDRPYRPAMSDEQAIEILVQRRGSMYDPLVVDTFVREYPVLKAEVERDIARPSAISPRHDLAPGQPPPDSLADRGELLSSLDLLSTLFPLGHLPELSVVGRDIISQLRKVAAFDTAAIYTIDGSLLSLRCTVADGPLAERVEQRSIPVAEQLTGWVAAHRTPVWNSDAALDLVFSVDGGAMIASSLPLDDDTSVRGVLTLYGHKGQEISVSERRAIELLLPALSTAVAGSSPPRGRGIDCRDSTVRTASLGLLDALLSHGRLDQDSAQSVSVMAISMSPISSDLPSIGPDTLDSPMSSLITLLSGADDGRIVLRLGARFLLVCVCGPDAKKRLQTDLRQVPDAGALQAVSVSCIWVETPQMLQDVVRRLLEGAPTHNDTRARVH